MFRPVMIVPRDERARQITVAAAILLGLALVICAVLLGWRHVPGLAGEWLGFVIGIITTPFFMEASFAVVGISVVLAINHWRQKRTGDDFRFLEQVKGGAELPEHASWAIFPDKPLAVEFPTLQAQAEGAMAIGDHEEAAKFFAAFTETIHFPLLLCLRCGFA